MDVSNILQEKSSVAETEKNKFTPTDEVRESDASGRDAVITANGFPSFSEESTEIERFGVKRFMLSDFDIRFYTGLPDYNIFAALFNLLRPRSGFKLNYYNGYTNAPLTPTICMLSLGEHPAISTRLMSCF